MYLCTVSGNFSFVTCINTFLILMKTAKFVVIWTNHIYENLQLSKIRNSLKRLVIILRLPLCDCILISDTEPHQCYNKLI
jgi:hypothetical protein